MKDIDFTKLLGFGTVTGHIAGEFDFRDETVAAKLGAKIGEPTVRAPRKPFSETQDKSR
jgi:hypothetical protein